jgi:NAD(P)H-flavin reductase
VSDAAEAELSARWQESAAHLGVRLTAPRLAAAHAAAGQFVMIGGPGCDEASALPLALASAPGEGPELLVKAASPAGELLAGMALGDRLQVYGPGGRGFPLDQHVGLDLVLCAAGSGIAPMRAVIHAVMAERRRFGKVALFYGQRSEDELAYRGEHPAWRQAGIEITCVLSGQDGQHVHQALTRRGLELSAAVVYVAGMPEMIAHVTVAAAELGLPTGRVFMNY